MIKVWPFFFYHFVWAVVDRHFYDYDYDGQLSVERACVQGPPIQPRLKSAPRIRKTMAYRV